MIKSGPDRVDKPSRRSQVPQRHLLLAGGLERLATPKLPFAPPEWASLILRSIFANLPQAFTPTYFVRASTMRSEAFY